MSESTFNDVSPKDSQKKLRQPCLEAIAPEMMGPMNNPRKYVKLERDVRKTDPDLKVWDSARGHLQIHAHPDTTFVKKEQITNHLHGHSFTRSCRKSIHHPGTDETLVGLGFRLPDAAPDREQREKDACWSTAKDVGRRDNDEVCVTESKDAGSGDEVELCLV